MGVLGMIWMSICQVAGQPPFAIPLVVSFSRSHTNWRNGVLVGYRHQLCSICVRGQSWAPRGSLGWCPPFGLPRRVHAKRAVRLETVELTVTRLMG